MVVEVATVAVEMANRGINLPQVLAFAKANPAQGKGTKSSRAPPAKTVLPTRNANIKVSFPPVKPSRRGGGTFKKIQRKLKVRSVHKTRRQFGGTFQEEVLAIYNFLFQVTLKEFLLTGLLNWPLTQLRAEELFDNLDKNA
jgi:hypothetical protein